MAIHVRCPSAEEIERTADAMLCCPGKGSPVAYEFMLQSYQSLDRERCKLVELKKICKSLAKWRTGPAASQSARAAWIGRVLDLAQLAREALAKGGA